MITIGNFNKTLDNEYVLEAAEGEFTPSMAQVQEIVAESSQDMYELQASLLVADVSLEAAVTEGAEDVEALLESVVKDSLEKAKKAFAKFFQKVKAWLASVKKNVELVFSSGEKFADKYEKELKDKAVGDFEYEGHEYTLKAGADKVTGAKQEIEKFLADTLNFDKSLDTVAKQKANLQNEANHGSEVSKSEHFDAMVKAAGGDDRSDLLEKVRKAFVGGKDSKETIKGIDVTKLLGIIRFRKEAVKTINDADKKNSMQYKSVMRAIDGARKEIKKLEESEGRGKALALANSQLALAHKALGLDSSLSGVYVKMVRKAASESESALKSFLRYKTKDAASKDEKSAKGVEESATGLLDKAQSFI